MGAPLPLLFMGSPCSKLCRRSRTGRRCLGASPDLMSVAVAMLTVRMLEMLESSNNMVDLMVLITEVQRKCCRAREL